MKLKIAIFLGGIFFIAALFTLTDYGINWDTINHLPRGQVYLRYMLTGKRDFDDLAPYQMYWQDPRDLLPAQSIRELPGPARSFYQSNAFNFDWYMEIDGTGHPPLSDILSSVFNRVLYGHLKIINDIDSYRVYGILLAAILVGAVYFWVGSVYGGFSGLVAALSLATYPLFWAESHFNTEKDVPEAVYFFLFIFSFYKGFVQKSVKWILVSGLFLGFALGTKFNILFVVFIIIPWLALYLKGKFLQKNNFRLLLWGLVAFLIGIVIFYATWPFLWQDIITGTQKVFGFYKEIGTSVATSVNFYPLIWIATTIPLVILFLFLVGLFGIFAAFKKDKTFTGLILLLGFAVPVVRVMWPGSNIYGGIRQIMEYVPFMAAISGIGAGYLGEKLKNFRFIFVILIFTFLFLNLYRTHPNENAFFNSLVGGLKGAKEKNITSWGNTFGGAYRQGFVWINKHAESGSRLVYAYELMPNAPLIWVRPDISFSNTQRSGFLRQGEYAITLTYDGISTRSYYDAYLENLMEPVYESNVDGVSVVKVWKNDNEHAKEGYEKITEIKNIFLSSEAGKTVIDLKKSQKLSYLKVSFPTLGCEELTNAKIYLSDDKIFWKKLKDELPMDEIPPLGPQPGNGIFYYPFSGEEAKFIKLDTTPAGSCESRIDNVVIGVFE